MLQRKVGFYLRSNHPVDPVSGDNALKYQFDKLNSFVKEKNKHQSNWGKVIEIYSDECVSALASHKPAYERMLTDLRREKINCIVARDVERLSRSPLDTQTLINLALEHSAGVFVVGGSSGPWNLCESKMEMIHFLKSPMTLKSVMRSSK